jgi:hypothetical protein
MVVDHGERVYDGWELDVIAVDYVRMAREFLVDG